MSEQELISHIEELGLSNKEARVYVACLKTGPSAVQRIADQADIKRVTTYVILESLVGLGLVSQSVKGKKTYFIAEEPANLHRLLDKREQELKEQKQNFDQVLPELQSLKSIPKESPDVKLYDGAESIKTIIDTYLSRPTLHHSEMVYGFSNLDQVYSYFPEVNKGDANPRRLAANIKSRFIYTSSDGPVMAAGDKAANRESRYLPRDKFKVTGDFTIIGDTIVMLSLGKNAPMGVTITSPDLAQGMRAFFDIAWEAAESYNPPPQ